MITKPHAATDLRVRDLKENGRNQQNCLHELCHNRIRAQLLETMDVQMSKAEIYYQDIESHIQSFAIVPILITQVP